MRALASALFSLAVTTAAASAYAERPYVVFRDVNGTAAASASNPPLAEMRTELEDAYAETGLPVPEVFSIWTAFPMTGNDFATYIDLRGNDVKGVGMQKVFLPDGLKAYPHPPTRALLWHNDVLAMDKRAALHGAAIEGYARYLFLLELSHLFGPQIAAPAPNASELEGFPFHWSFFLDAGGSPAGGNVWTDNGDGTFTVGLGDPATLKYSMLDLYLWGLAEPSEVPPFGVIEPTDVPATPTDAFWGGSYAAHSFPWFDPTEPPLVVTGTRRVLTIDDVVAANGARSPGAGEKSSWTLGIVLLVGADASDADVADAMAAMDPVAESLAPAFADATRGRGTLEVVTVAQDGGGGGGGGAGGAAGTGGGGGGEVSSEAAGGCDCAASPGEEARSRATWPALLFGALVAWRRKRRGRAA